MPNMPLHYWGYTYNPAEAVGSLHRRHLLVHEQLVALSIRLSKIQPDYDVMETLLKTLRRSDHEPVRTLSLILDNPNTLIQIGCVHVNKPGIVLGHALSGSRASVTRHHHTAFHHKPHRKKLFETGKNAVA